MVFVNQSKFRGGRGRGRGIGEVAFQPRTSTHEGGDGSHGEFDSRPSAAEELRITVGNDKYRDKSGSEDKSHPGFGHRLGPPVGGYERDYSSPYRGESERSNPYRPQSHDDYGRGYEREAGDRRGIGASSGVPSSQPLFAAASRMSGPIHSGSPLRAANPPPPADPSASASRPLKSILKKKNDPVEKKDEPPARKPALPGMANYIDDIDDEEKFLYGEDDSKKSGGRSDIYGHKAPVSSGPNIRSAAQAWKPSAPSNTVSGIVSEFVSSQRDYTDKQQQRSQPAVQTPQGGQDGGDIWSMLAKSVQTVQQLQPQQQDIYSNQQQKQYAPPVPPTVQPTPVQPEKPDSSHDPTIENILKSIGFDFDMSKRMQEKAKQASGEPVPAKPPTTEDSQFGINHGASFIGSGMSHEDMRSSLGGMEQLQKDYGHGLGGRDSRERDCYSREDTGRRFEERDRRERDYDDERRESLERNRNIDNEYDRRDSHEYDRRDSHDRNRGRRFEEERPNSQERGKPSYDMFSSPPRQRRGEKDLSPVSDDGSPPPPMFNLPPITIKRKSVLERNRSPGWDRKDSPERTIQVTRRSRSRSPSYTKSTSSFGRRSNRSRSLSREKSPIPRKASPIIRRTITIPFSPDIRKKTISSSSDFRGSSPSGKRRSPVSRKRSRSPGSRRRSRSPGRGRSRSPGRGRSPGKRKSPVRGRSPRRSKSPGRRRSRSPRRRSGSPRSKGGRRRSHSPKKSPRRRSISPRGRKRGYSPRSTSRDRKMRRSGSRDRRSRSRSKGRRSRSRSMDRRPKSDSDSDVDGPANQQYFSSPLRLEGRPPNRFFNKPPGPHNMPGPPPNFGPPGPPPMFAPGPGGPPPFSMPPPPFGMPPQMQQPIAYPPTLSYIVPTVPPPVVDTSVPPPGALEIPLSLPSRQSNLPEVPGEERRNSGEDNRDKGGSNRTVLPPKSSVKTEERSHERIIVVGKPKAKPPSRSVSSSSSGKDTSIKVVVDPIKDKEQVMKEKQDFDSKINLLQTEFTNLKKLEEDLKSNSKNSKDNETIIEENSKLREEIKKELSKLVRERKAFETKNADILKKVTVKREIVVSKKEDPAKKPSTTKKEEVPEKREVKPAAKKEIIRYQDADFKVEKGRLMKHQFFDSGDHWCKGCDIDFHNIHDYVQHLSSYKHKQSIPSDFKPWKEGFQPNQGMIVNKNGIRVPLPGIEFMYPVTAYYCKICKEFLGDVSSGVDHFRCESHYINYQNYCKDNPYHAKKLKEEKEVYYKKKSEEKKKEKREKEKDKLTVSEVREKERNKKIETDAKHGRSDRRNSDDSSEVIQSSEKERSNDYEENQDKSERESSDKGKYSKKPVPSKTSALKKPPTLPPWQNVGKKVEEPSKSSLDSFLTTNSGKIPVIMDKKKVSAQDVLKAYNEKKRGEREAKEKEMEEQLEKERKEKESLQLQLDALKNIHAMQLGMQAGKHKDDTVKDEDKDDDDNMSLDSDVGAEDKEDTKKTTSSTVPTTSSTVPIPPIVNIHVPPPPLPTVTPMWNMSYPPPPLPGAVPSLPGAVPSLAKFVPPPPPPLDEDKEDLKLMGIDPETTTPLAHIKPPPPRSQNVRPKDQKACSTASEKDVNSLYFANSSKSETKSKACSVVVSIPGLDEIPLPGVTPELNVVKISDDQDSEKVKNEKDTKKRKKKEDKKDIKKDLKTESPQKSEDSSSSETSKSNRRHWKVFFEPVADEKEQINDKTEKQTDNNDTIEEKGNETKDISDSSDIKGMDKCNESEVEGDQSVNKELDTNTTLNDDDKSKVENDTDKESNKDETIDMEIKKGNETKLDSENEKQTAIEKSAKEEESSPKPVVETGDTTEEDEPIPQKATRGRKRGRGRGKRGRGRGSRAASKSARSTRSTRSSNMPDTVEESPVDDIASDVVKSQEGDNIDNVTESIADAQSNPSDVVEEKIDDIGDQEIATPSSVDGENNSSTTQLQPDVVEDQITEKGSDEKQISTNATEDNTDSKTDVTLDDVDTTTNGTKTDIHEELSVQDETKSTEDDSFKVSEVLQTDTFDDSLFSGPPRRTTRSSWSNMLSQECTKETNKSSPEPKPESEDIAGLSSDSKDLVESDNIVDDIKNTEILNIGLTVDNYEDDSDVESITIGDDKSITDLNVTSEPSSVLLDENKTMDVLLTDVNVESSRPSVGARTSSRQRRRSTGVDKGNTELPSSDVEDAMSEISGMMGSDFEVVDDIDDITDVLPL